MKSENHEESKSFSKEYAFKTLDIVNMWINNCDSKASIILGSIGVIFSIILSSDFTKAIKRIIENAFINIDFYKIVYIIILILAISICVIGLFYLVSCIVPTIILNKSNSKKIKKRKNSKSPAINSPKSLMFYGIIATEEYEEYLKLVISNCDNFDTVMSDLTFQIHSASVICNSKFKKLQKGITLFSIGFLICCILMIIGQYSL